MTTLTSALLAVLYLFPHSCPAQEPAQPPPPAAPASPSSGEPSAADKGTSSSKPKSRGIPSFLIIGTVFNEHALSFPGAQVRIRRRGEKRFVWEAYTDSRGEFAARVPPGYEYEVVVHVKKYEDQTQNVDAKGDVQQRLSIKLEPKGQANTGGKS
jgi:Carboxypeptidase regulatory-like domain